PDTAKNQVYNVAVGDRTTLNQLFSAITSALTDCGQVVATAPQYRDFRSGDVRHSLADISKAERLLGYQPQYRIGQGISEAMQWYIAFLQR
ncbi:LPS biosynthesis protein WbpP, partial [Enterococcus faecium]